MQQEWWNIGGRYLNGFNLHESHTPAWHDTRRLASAWHRCFFLPTSPLLPWPIYLSTTVQRVKAFIHVRESLLIAAYFFPNTLRIINLIYHFFPQRRIRGARPVDSVMHREYFQHIEEVSSSALRVPSHTIAITACGMIGVYVLSTTLPLIPSPVTFELSNCENIDVYRWPVQVAKL